MPPFVERLAGPALSLLLALPTATLADTDIHFATASEGRAYWGVGQRLKEVAATKGLNVEVLATQGSQENMRRLADPNDPVNLILTQADALHAHLRQDPSFGDNTLIMENIGPECVFVIASTLGKIDSEEAWHAANGAKVALPGPESGVAMTHAVMAHFIPELADDEPVYAAPDEAMSRLEGEGDLGVDLVFAVHRAKFRGDELKSVLAEPGRYRFIPVTDKRLDVKLPDGRKVYEFLDLPLLRASTNGPQSVETICTRGLLVGSLSKLDPDAKASLQQVLDFQWMEIYPEQRD